MDSDHLPDDAHRTRHSHSGSVTIDVNTRAFHRFAAGSRAGGHISQMNSPWGLAVAPSTFGEHANQLLVGNFGSGTIVTFDAGSYSSPLVRERARRSMNRKARRPMRPEAASCCFKSSSCFAFASVLVISANGTWQRWLSHRPNLRGPVASVGLAVNDAAVSARAVRMRSRGCVWGNRRKLVGYSVVT